MTLDLPVDANNHVIQASSDLEQILNVTTNASTRVSVEVSASCKCIIMKSRSGEAFRIYESNSSVEYFTCDGEMCFNIHPTNQTSRILFYVLSPSGGDVLEVLVLS